MPAIKKQMFLEKIEEALPGLYIMNEYKRFLTKLFGLRAFVFIQMFLVFFTSSQTT